ncbi:MAG TPA: heparan-alpha-glucosaminide N-acetyltransferase [Methanocorpusculum sp.]|nr:heparan-alpha-glucosaminide N-acetyltransferase [Methanocorpusculum sp.]
MGDITNKPERYWEIDALRGIAILGMLVVHFFAFIVIFHWIEETPEFLAVYNLYVFGTAIFVIVAGVAMILRHDRMAGKTNREYYFALFSRAVFLFGIAMAITVATWIGFNTFMGQSGAIIFGFLHMLSISMMIAIPLLRFGKWNIVIGLFLIALGLLVIPLFDGPWWLFAFGIQSPDFYVGPDYFGLLPWSGVLLLGIGLGSIFYPNGKRGFSFPSPKKIGRFFQTVGNGRVTLFIYLTHAPVMLVILYLISVCTGFGYL